MRDDGFCAASLRTCFVFWFFLFTGSFALAQTINGKITDEKGTPLPEASISIKGKDQSILSALDGTFSVEVQKGDVLIFTYVGYESMEVTVKDQSQLNVRLKEESTTQLQEIVALGILGKKKINDYTGATSVVRAADIKGSSFSSVQQALEGKVTGAQVSTDTGQPGAHSDVKIRGISSINGNRAPLYIVDGLPSFSGNLQGMSSFATSFNILSNFNSYDVSEMIVLKDAAATAVYGARGANGVIIINTASGRRGEPRFNLDMETGISQLASNSPKRLNAFEKFELLSESLMNTYGFDKKKAETNAKNIILKWDGKTNTDWGKVIERNVAIRKKMNFSMSMGNEQSRFYASLGAFSEDSPIKGSGFDRYTGFLSLFQKVNEKIDFTFKLNVSHSKMKSVLDEGAFMNPLISKYFNLPTDPLKKADGTYFWNSQGKTTSVGYNPAYLAEHEKQNFQLNRFMGAFEGNYNIAKGLKYTLRFGGDFSQANGYIYRNPDHGDGKDYKGLVSEVGARNLNWAMNNVLSYQPSLPKVHDLQFIVLQETQKNNAYHLTGTRHGTPAEMISLGTSVKVDDASSGSIRSTSISYAANASYNYDKTYYFDATYRREGNSVFLENRKWGNFWAVSGAVNLARWIKNESIRHVKPRISYGQLGSDGITSGAGRSLMEYISYDGNSALFLTGVANPTLSWELIRTLNAGIDFNFFNNRLSGGIEYFDKRTHKLLIQEQLSRTSGLTSTWRNIGRIQNQGFELELRAKPFVAKNPGGFYWRNTLTLSTVKNKILELPKDKNGKYVEYVNSLEINKVGHTVNAFYMQKWVGVDPNNGDPLWVGQDGKPTNQYKDAKKFVLQNKMPSVTGGFSNTFGYKGFELGVSFFYSFGGKIYDSFARYLLSDGATPLMNGYREQLNRWQKPGDKAPNPKVYYGGQRPNQQGNNNSNEYSSRFLYKSDYIRLSEVALGYGIPEKLLKQARLNRLYFYVKANNLWTHKFDKKLLLEPDAGDLSIPKQRVFSLGVQLGF